MTRHTDIVTHHSCHNETMIHVISIFSHPTYTLAVCREVYMSYIHILAPYIQTSYKYSRTLHTAIYIFTHPTYSHTYILAPSIHIQMCVLAPYTFKHVFSHPTYRTCCNSSDPSLSFKYSYVCCSLLQRKVVCCSVF